jgi:triphosphoribosyl-dephospho-CoA synthase
MNIATFGEPDDAASCFPFDRQWSLPAAAQLACVLEATAPKVGNVHPGVAFADMQYGDFLKSAAAIGCVFAKAGELSVGELVLEGVLATRTDVGLNTNLGTLLLFAPLAKARFGSESISLNDLRTAAQVVLRSLEHDDSKAIYEAIRIAKPGGLGESSQHDVHAEAPADLIVAMRHASPTDAVAAQYVNGYTDLFDRLVPWFDEAQKSGQDVLAATCTVQVRWLAEECDGLIVRKCGARVATEVQSLARRVVQAETVDCRRSHLSELDNYLREDGHRRNPGTTADLIAAMLFVKLLCSV